MRAQPEVGSTANSYAIVAKLATGGMADIFLARTESGAGVERYVVLKRVLRQRATDIKFINMFLDEARLASQLQHPNIAQVYDTGKLGDSYFFTMEYVHGETVRELLHRAYAVGQPVPLAAALAIVAGAAAGLQHAHERVGVDGKPLNIVHRDVSPSNLMISYEGNVKLVDFGVAKASLQSTETQSGTVKGKIGYMAPEQCRGGQVDQRCDLFSLGIVMWELLAGERLFKRATEFESMEAIVNEPTPPPSSKRPEIPASIDAIVMKLLAKRPAERFQSADELHEAIEDAAVGVGIALSVPALKRYVRELFGMKPEPWVEMRLRESAPEIVTVTGQVWKEDAAERQLERVLDLSSTSITVESSGPRPLPALEGSEPKPRPPIVHRPPTAPTTTATSFPAPLDEPPPAPRPAGIPELATPRTSLADGAALSSTPSDVPGRSRLAILLGVLAVAVALGAIAFIATRSRPEPLEPVASVASSNPEVTEPERPVVAPPTPDAISQTVTEPEDELESQFKDHKFADVVSRCTTSGEVVASHAVTCALAACQIHDGDHARQWATKASPGERSALVSACATAGTELVKADKPPRRPVRKSPPARPRTPPVKPACDPSDPMSCRR